MHRIILNLYCVDPLNIVTIAKGAAKRNLVQFCISDHTVEFSGGDNQLKDLQKAASAVKNKCAKEKVGFDTVLEFDGQRVEGTKEENAHLLNYKISSDKLVKDKVKFL